MTGQQALAWHSRWRWGWRAAAGLLRALGAGLGLCLLAGVAQAANGPDPLTPAQRQWLAAHGPWRLGTEADYGPFVYAGAQGRVEGLSVDMLALAQQRIGLAVQTLPGRPLAQVLQSAARGEVDFISSLRPTPERAEFLLFTQPYISVPAVVVMPRASQPQRLADLGGQSVAVGKGYAVESVVRERYPNVRWQAVADDVAALKGVADGRYAAAVVDAASLAFVVREHQLPGLVATGEANFHYALSFAVRKDLPELRDILDAAFRSLGQAERQRVIDRWLLPADLDAATRSSPWATRLAAALLLGGALLAARWLWVRQRRAAKPSAP
jgi:ABC-type amino acid transport substrate-binding protein